tara:strand:- start:545 stop:793 length:249 start_codon:yes stop_codon:yes gene_type:complete
MELKTIFTIRKILTPFIVVFFSGIIGIIKWKEFINDLHKKAIEEKRNNVWFTKKSISLYFKIVLFFFINLLSWSILILFIFN